MTNFFFDFSNNKIKVYGTLVIVPLLLYYKSLYYDFSPMDEQWLIVKKVHFLQNWGNLWHVFSDHIMKLYYRPLLTASFIIDYHTGQLAPFYFHLTNVVFHVLSGIILYRLLLLMETNKTMAFLLSLLFLVHPLMLHAVAWIPGRNDSMLCVFVLSSFIFLIKYLTGKKIIHVVLNIFFFICALFTKENAIVLPILFAGIFFVYEKFSKKIIFPVISWLVIVVCWYQLKTAMVQSSINMSQSWPESFRDFILGFLTFAGKSFFPVQLSVSPVLKSIPIVSGLFALAGIVFLIFKFRLNNKKIAGFGILVFVVLLAIPVWYGATSTLGEQYEHRAYTSLAGLMIFISQVNFNYNSKMFRYAFGFILILFALKTFIRMDVYKNDISYANEGINDCPENYMFHFKKATILAGEHNFSEALIYYNNALKLQPNRPQILTNRGIVYVELGQKDKAIADFNVVLNIEFNSYVLLTRCIAYQRFDDFENALKDLATLKKCCAREIPKGLEEEIIKKWNLSIFSQINEQIQKEPNNAILYVNRAKFYMDRRMGREALADLKKACELEPDNKEFKSYYNELNSTFPH